MWQVTLKRAYTLDPTKSEWDDYAAVQASRHSEGTYKETSSRAPCHETLGHSRLSSLNHCGLILAERVELVRAS